MGKKALVVDDDLVTLKLIELILTRNGYEYSGFENPKEALKKFFSTNYDVVISDYYMPLMNGDKLLEEIRIKDKFIPFIILTSNKNLDTAVELIKKGADDYITKPVVKEDLLFRIAKNIKESNNRKLIDRIEKEQEIEKLESQRLANWKMLYATKDTKQSQILIELFNRTLNEGGGYSWLDLLKQQIEKIDDAHYKIDSGLADLIIKTSERHRTFFNNISYIASINSINLNVNTFTYNNFIETIKKYAENDLAELAEKYNHTLFVLEANQFIEGEMTVCIEYICKIVKELVINAIKYSPEQTPIYIMFEKNPDFAKGTYIDVTVKSTPRIMNSRQSDYDRHFKTSTEPQETKDFTEDTNNVILFGETTDEKDTDIIMFGDDDNLEQHLKAEEDTYNKVVGIPYEYSELVFDLFYTIEPFPVELDEEEWKGGTGLYIARKLINRHNGWIRNANGIDYSRGEPEQFISFIITLPYARTVK